MELYLYLTSNVSFHILSNFAVDTPKLRNLKRSWECALVELSLECNFMTKSDRLHLCGGFLEESFVNQDRLLRNIEVRGKYKKYPSERYMDRSYVPMFPSLVIVTTT